MCPSPEQEEEAILASSSLPRDPWQQWFSRVLVVAGTICAVYSVVITKEPTLVTASLGMYLIGQGGATLVEWGVRRSQQ